MFNFNPCTDRWRHQCLCVPSTAALAYVFTLSVALSVTRPIPTRFPCGRGHSCATWTSPPRAGLLRGHQMTVDGLALCYGALEIVGLLLLLLWNVLKTILNGMSDTVLSVVEVGLYRPKWDHYWRRWQKQFTQFLFLLAWRRHHNSAFFNIVCVINVRNKMRNILVFSWSKSRKPLHSTGQQELSYRKQIARQLRTQYVEGIYDNPVTLKSRLMVTQGHWKWNHWVDHTRLTISWVIWRWIWSWPWNVGQRSLKIIENGTIWKLGYDFLFAFHSNYWRIFSHFGDIQRQRMIWPWNWVWGCSRSLKMACFDRPCMTFY